jgi:hypothetical protein
MEEAISVPVTIDAACRQCATTLSGRLFEDPHICVRNRTVVARIRSTVVLQSRIDINIVRVEIDIHGSRRALMQVSNRPRSAVQIA